MRFALGKTALPLVIGMLAAVAPASAQQRIVNVESNQNDANVFVDAEWIGHASQSPFGVPRTARRLTVSPPGLDAWSIEPIHVELAAADGDTVFVEANFPYHYKFDSIPMNVSVALVRGDVRRELGRAPLLHVEDDALDGSFVFEKSGYRTVRRPVRAELWNRYLVELERLELPVETPDLALGTDSGGSHRWIDVVSVSASIAAGALAVHYRTKADNRFETWKETGDPALKDEIRRLDLYSGVALGTMQVGIGVFAFRLIF